MMYPMTEQIMERLLLVVVVLVGAIVLRLFLAFLIRRVRRSMMAKPVAQESEALGDKARYLLAKASGLADERRRQRIETTASLLRNVVDVVIVSVTLLTVLAIVGVPMTPLLASAGVGGLAVGFGAQSLVKDYISGILMILEDQFGVGDLIDTGEVVGTVEEVGLRVTKLRDSGGQAWYVRNGEIQRVGNQSQGWSTAIVDVPIAAGEDPAEAIDVLQGVVTEVCAGNQYANVLLDDPTVAGVNEVRPGAIVLRITAKTAPNQQWALQRDLLARSVDALHAAGIQDPLPPPVA